LARDLHVDGSDLKFGVTKACTVARPGSLQRAEEIFSLTQQISLVAR